MLHILTRLMKTSYIKMKLLTSVVKKSLFYDHWMSFMVKILLKAEKVQVLYLIDINLSKKILTGKNIQGNKLKILWI